MVANVTNMGVAQFRKSVIQDGNSVKVNIFVHGPKAHESRPVDLLKIEQRNRFRIASNHGTFGPISEGNSSKPLYLVDSINTGEELALWKERFVDSLRADLKKNFPPAAICYNLQHGSRAELAETMKVLNSSLTFNTPLLVSGAESELTGYEYLDNFKVLTQLGFNRRIDMIRAEWKNRNLVLDQFIYSGLAMVRAIQHRDNKTGGHSVCVSSLANPVAEKMGLPALEQWLLSVAGILHDIGKVGISDSILLKPGRFDEAERAEMNQHPVFSAEIASPLSRILGGTLGSLMAQMITYHHCRYDGKGYPQIAKETNLSMLTFIIQLVDCLDAMTANKETRSYRESEYSKQAVLDDLNKNSGKQFHPEVAAAASAAIEDGFLISTKVPVPSNSTFENQN